VIVTILLVTYNHARFIGRAMRSLLGQLAPGPVELVVADDGSSDGTLDLIREFDGSDPRFRFKYLDSSSNVGITKNYQRGLANCSGTYVAILEGDDYWTSPGKLQRQVEFLENHWECDLCSVNYFVYDEERSDFRPRVTPGMSYRQLSARELIADNLVGNFSTCMYRREALAALPPSIFEVPFYDWIVNICVARTSLIGFIEEPMSVYRRHSSGLWSGLSPVAKLKAVRAALPKYNALTNRVFEAEFKALARRLRIAIAEARLKRAKSWVTGFELRPMR
jgi:glycosyltransferase involved in cell wall biosynthesis